MIIIDMWNCINYVLFLSYVKDSWNFTVFLYGVLSDNFLWHNNNNNKLSQLIRKEKR